MSASQPMLIGVCGYARSGKTTVAESLVRQFNFEHRNFAADLKAAINTLNPLVGVGDLRVMDAIEIHGADEAKEAFPEVRRLYQVMGTEVGRAWSPTFWIDRTLDNLVNPVVVADLRFINEGDAIQARGGYVIRVHRDGVKPLNSHASEMEVDSIPADFHIDNNDTIEWLDGVLNDMILDLSA